MNTAWAAVFAAWVAFSVSVWIGVVGGYVAATFLAGASARCREPGAKVGMKRWSVAALIVGVAWRVGVALIVLGASVMLLFGTTQGYADPGAEAWIGYHLMTLPAFAVVGTVLERYRR